MLIINTTGDTENSRYRCTFIPILLLRQSPLNMRVAAHFDFSILPSVQGDPLGLRLHFVDNRFIVAMSEGVRRGYEL